MVGAFYVAYTDRFHELAKLVPHLVTLESKRINNYIYGLAPEIRGMVQATKPSMIHSVILRARALTNDTVRDWKLSKSGDKRKAASESRNQASMRHDNKKEKLGNRFVATNPSKKEYKGNLPKCAKCNGHHRETASFNAYFNHIRPGK
uniref:Reverse transcriptase domain-containing protein n=1 Tax=Tanacetum cinerariifolium TaxID=118510 RepID=A0A699I6L8_TANCI|nr:reverse transcriptase domain-containing protein [Tanacetum cinerariifolium]